MTGDLAEADPNVELQRIALNAVEVDFGEPESVYVIMAEFRARATLPVRPRT